ncbi:MAG: DUF4340 domain-containing protein [Acidobacteria bacterium]|nr:DUF4340 domain-containing protein [Acidobacteriota bacterium]
MNVKHTLLAFAIFLALGSAFYYLNRLPEKPGKDDIPKENLFTFTPDQVEEFTLEEQSKPVANFRRTGGTVPASASTAALEPGADKKGKVPQWQITTPEGIAADSVQIHAFLGEIVAMKGTPLATTAAPQWSEYGLDAQQKTYRFKLKDGKTVEFSIGVQNPAGYAHYARRDGAAPVLLIDDIDDKALIEKTLFDLRDKRILPIEVEQSERIELHFSPTQQSSAEELAKAKQLSLPIKPPRIVLTKQPNGNWNLDEPNLRTDHGSTNYFLTTISGGSMQSVEEEKAASLGKYGLDRPRIRLVMTTPSGTQSLLVGNSVKRGEQELFYAKNSVWPHIFTVFRTVYDQLNQDLEAYRNRFLYDFAQGSADRLEIQGPTGQLHFARRGEDWFLASTPEKKMDGTKVGDFLNSIHALRISSYPSDAPNRFAAYGLDKPWMKVQVTFGEKSQEETVLYARQDKKFYAARQGEPSVYELSPFEPDNLEAKLKELTADPAAAAQSSPPSPTSATP